MNKQDHKFLANYLFDNLNNNIEEILPVLKRQFPILLIIPFQTDELDITRIWTFQDHGGKVYTSEICPNCSRYHLTEQIYDMESCYIDHHWNFTIVDPEDYSNVIISLDEKMNVKSFSVNGDLTRIIDFIKMVNDWNNLNQD